MRANIPFISLGGHIVAESVDVGVEAAAKRIHDHYLDMPGLCLTPQQAQKLCHLPSAVCYHALERLVEDGALVRTPKGNYVRRA
jgi:hypothetical protein